MPATVALHEQHWFGSEPDAELYKARQKSRWAGHVAPYSVLVAAMGNHWVQEPVDCQAAVQATAKHHADHGYRVCLYEVQDMCLQPYDALGIMRNKAMFRAIDEGFEYLCYVDNDVEPPPDALYKLVSHQMEVMAPRIEFWNGEDYGLDMPKTQRDVGLGTCVNVVLSMLVFRTAALLPWRSAGFWENPVGADESYHFQKLNKVLFFDTGMTVKVWRPPHFPLNDAVGRTLSELDRASLARVRDGSWEGPLWTP